ncbi:MAG: hypothetical protein ACPLZG_08285 [Thermoproteota archaeon]
MAWGWWGGYGRGYGLWPGRGPFSYLPPWQRPGWYFGRGACWWLFGYPWYYAFPYSAPYARAAPLYWYSPYYAYPYYWW